MDKYHLVAFILGVSLTLLSITTYNVVNNPEPQRVVEVRDPEKAYLDIVSKTEYYANETGQVIVRISNWQGYPLSATCNATIVYPNKTIWLVDQPMSTSSIAGNYYHTVTIPDVLGVYEYSFDCIAQLNGRPYPLSSSSSFHVSVGYQKFQQILDLIDDLNSSFSINLDDLNSTLIAQLNEISDQIISVNDTVISVNGTLYEKIVELNDTMINQFGDQTTLITNYYHNIMTSIYNLQQKWLDISNDIVQDLIGAGQSLNRIGDTIGITTTANCGIWDQLTGRC